MSEELIKRLRKWAKSDLGLIVMYEAADTIEAQAAEIAEYRRQHCSAAEIARPLLDALETRAKIMTGLWPVLGGDMLPYDIWREISEVLTEAFALGETE